MGDRCRFPDVGLRHGQGGPRTLHRHPESAHGNGGRHLEVHAVAHVHPAVLMTLRVTAFHAVFLGDQVDPVVILGKEFTYGLPPVKKELLALFGTLDDFSGEHRQPGQQVVAPPRLEFSRKAPGPGHLFGLIAVGKDILDSVLANQPAGGFLVHIHVVTEVLQPGILVQFVHFQAGSLRRGRMVLFSGQGRAETVDAPVPFRDPPSENAVQYGRCKVDGFKYRGAGFRRRIVHEVMRGGKSGLFLGMVHFGNCMKDEFMEGCTFRSCPHGTVCRKTHVRDGIGNTQPEIPGTRFRDIHGLLRNASGRDEANILPYLSVGAGLQFVGISWSFSIPLPAYGTAHKGKGPYRDGLRESVLDPGILAGWILRQYHSIGQIPVREHFHRKISATGGDGCAQLGKRLLGVGNPDGHDGHILVPGRDGRWGCLEGAATPRVLEFTHRGVGLRQGNRLRLFGFGISRHLHAAPGELFHGILRLHPGTARGTPAGGRCNGNLHTQGIGIMHGIAEGLFPAVLHVGKALHNGGGSAHHGPAGIELLDAAHPGGFHPFQVGLDAVFGDIGVHPMPPHADARLLRRVGEIGFIGLGKGAHCKQHACCEKDLFFQFIFNSFSSLCSWRAGVTVQDRALASLWERVSTTVEASLHNCTL